jgi:phage shock protein A
MKESLTARVGRIVSGGAHMLVEAVENVAPEAVMEQAIREVEGAMDEVRRELGRVVANKHLANRRLTAESRRHEELADKLELALSEGRDDLAEAVVSQQLDIEAQIPVLEATIREAVERESELEGFVAALKAKRREMESELGELRTSRAAAGSGASGDSAEGLNLHQLEGDVEKAESAFERLLQRQTGLDSAAGRQDAESAAKMAELEDLTRKNRIQERLAAAKARQAGDA